jgi:hypothetical protein
MSQDEQVKRRVGEGVVSREMGGVEVYTVELSEEEKVEIRRQQEEFKPVYRRFMTDQEDPFFLSPDTYNTLIGLVPSYFEDLRGKLEITDTLEEWELRNIGAILGKALIPDSIAPTLENAQRVGRDIEQFHQEGERIRVRELCGGAGLSTVMTWKEGRRQTDAPMTFISTDNALESITTSAILLSSLDIPHVIVQGEIPADLLDFDGVVLQYMDAGRAVSSESARDYKYDFVISDHGVSYFPEQLHDTAVGNSLDLLDKYGVMYICGLEPDVTIDLDYPFMIKEILFGGGKRRREYEAIRAERQADIERGDRDPSTAFYDIEEEGGDRVALTAFYTKESAGLYDMLHSFLLTRGRDVRRFVQYIRAISDIVKTTRELGVEVQSPVSHTVEAVDRITDGEVVSEVFPPFEEGKRLARTIRVQVN